MSDKTKEELLSQIEACVYELRVLKLCNHSAFLALKLLQILRWPNPEGTIEERYIPRWLVDECHEAINLIPLETLKDELQRRQRSLPAGLLNL